MLRSIVTVSTARPAVVAGEHGAARRPERDARRGPPLGDLHEPVGAAVSVVLARLVAVRWAVTVSSIRRVASPTAPSAVLVASIDVATPALCSVTMRMCSSTRCGGGAGGVRQLADLVGDDGESASVLARAGRLDRGVQGQQTGLIGDRRDLAGDRGRGIRRARAG